MNFRRALRPSLVNVTARNLTAIAFIVTLYLPSHSQVAAGNASLYGSVRDPAGKPIASATIHLEVDGEAELQATHTDAQGEYSFTGLSGGIYGLKAESAGYTNAAIPSIFVAAKEAKSLDLRLEPVKAASPPPSASAPQFFDPPQFTVSGVTDTTSLGGHGPDTVIRTRETIAKETASLAKGSRISEPAAPESAEKALRNAVKREPGSFTANHELGKVLVRRGREREAIPYLQRAAQLNSGDYQNSFELAVAYAGSGDYSHALDTAQALLAHHDSAPLHHLLADVEEKQGNSLEAVREYQRAAELDSSEPNLFDWGSELLLHHAAEPAAQVFTSGHRRFPLSVRMLIGLGAADFADGSYDQAVEQICTASDLNPEDPVPYRFLGKMQQAQSVPSGQLVEKLHRFVTLHPDNAEANYFYAVGLWKQRKNEQAPATASQIETLLNRTVRLDPRFDAAYVQLGILHAEQRDLTQAITDFRRAIDAAPDLEEAHYRLAQAYRETGQTEQAKAEMKLYQRLAQESQQKTERERHEIRQFVYTLRDQPPHQSH